MPPLLDAVLRKMARDQGHWAYTWTSVWSRRRGRPGAATRTVADPSRPYGQQWWPVLIDGHPPDAPTLQGIRDRGEREAREAENRPPSNEDSEPYAVHMTMDYSASGNQRPVALYDQAKPVQEDGDHVVFDVPLQSDRRTVVLPQFWRHFHLLVRVNRRAENLEHVAIVLQRPIALVRVRRFQIDTDYATVDPRYSAVETSMDAEFDATLLVEKYYFRQQVTCSDFRRVTPYGDRFQVRIGPLRSLGMQPAP